MLFQMLIWHDGQTFGDEGWQQLPSIPSLICSCFSRKMILLSFFWWKCWSHWFIVWLASTCWNWRTYFMTWKSENSSVHWKNQSWFGTCISSNQKVSEWSTVNYYVASLLQDKKGKNNNNDCLVIKSAWYKLFSKLKIKSSTHYCTQ